MAYYLPSPANDNDDDVTITRVLLDFRVTSHGRHWTIPSLGIYITDDRYSKSFLSSNRGAVARVLTVGATAGSEVAATEAAKPEVVAVMTEGAMAARSRVNNIIFAMPLVDPLETVAQILWQRRQALLQRMKL